MEEAVCKDHFRAQKHVVHLTARQRSRIDSRRTSPAFVHHFQLTFSPTPSSSCVQLQHLPASLGGVKGTEALHRSPPPPDGPVVLSDYVIKVLHPPRLTIRGRDFSSNEMAKASGCEACLSVPVVNGRRRRMLQGSDCRGMMTWLEGGLWPEKLFLQQNQTTHMMRKGQRATEKDGGRDVARQGSSSRASSGPLCSTELLMALSRPEIFFATEPLYENCRRFDDFNVSRKRKGYDRATATKRIP